eukprot:UN32383
MGVTCSADRAVSEHTKKGRGQAKKSKDTRDTLFRKIIERNKVIDSRTLTKLWDRYDIAGRGFIGKSQIKKMLLDWVSALNSIDTRNIDEEHLIHFNVTIRERALRAKYYLDVRKTGRVRFSDFKRISEKKFWDLVGHKTLIDMRLEAIRMWRKIFNTHSEGIIPLSGLKLIWDRYEDFNYC